MRGVISRVLSAQVKVGGQSVGAIDRGLLVYLAVLQGDDQTVARQFARKLLQLRIFPDEAGKMNRNLLQAEGRLLLVPNFTLAGRTAKGTRPSFTDAADPDRAEQLFKAVADAAAEQVRTATGQFGAAMRIESVADGPVNVIVEVV
ncbi:MAG: D-aminoacyl-tRNA deacylase [Phycisphaeraceae bacterium]|nr:D-aminoacyl-tRNA deacylase [Phycisphaeraceae bacterium]